MLYDEGQLTESQAQQIIGKKMNARINFLNDWMDQNGYCIMLHSTFKGNVSGIFSEEGLHYPMYETIDTKSEILDDCTISERNLDRLENWIKTNKKNGELQAKYETYLPTEKATTVMCSQLSAKLLLEYNHLGANTTIVFCVPRKKDKKIGRDNPEFRMGFLRKFDPYLRRKISGKLQKDGSVDFISTYSYPTEGILFAFDRENIKIVFNDKFDEEYYLDETTPQKGMVHKGDIFNGLRNLQQQNIAQNSGRSR